MPAIERRVTILYFSALRERLGIQREELSLPLAVRSIAELSSHLETLRPALQGLLGSVRFAVDEEFVPFDHPLSSGNVIALIPPVSGG